MNHSESREESAKAPGNCGKRLFHTITMRKPTNAKERETSSSRHAAMSVKSNQLVGPLRFRIPLRHSARNDEESVQEVIEDKGKEVEK